MSCIHCYSPPLSLFTLQKQRQNVGKSTKFSWFLSNYSTNKHSNLSSQVGVVPLKVEDFAMSLNLAVAKPPNTQVLIQTSALMIFFYLISNFVVPQFLTKSLQPDEKDENEMPKPNTDPVDEEKASSTKTKRGFNSTKPK
ncbi:Insulin receptor substrate 1 [Bienertia sinuspersici]